MFAARGMQARTVLHPAADSRLVQYAQVIVVDSATRDASPAVAYGSVREAAAGLRDAGARFIAKRIDTTLRGAIGTEIKAVLDALDGRAVAVVVPAAPEAGRTAVGGRVFLNGRPLSAITGGRDDVRSVLIEPAFDTVASTGLDTVRRGTAAVAETVADAARRGVPVIAFDAETRDDVRTIASGVKASEIEVVPVDPGGFTLALATVQGLVPQRRGAGGMEAVPQGDEACSVMPARPAGGRSRLLAIFGSPAPIAVEQIGIAVTRGVVSIVELDAEVVQAGSEQARREIARVVEALRSDGSPTVGVRVGGPAQDAREPIIAALTDVVLRVLREDRSVAGLYLSGGDVARATLERLGATAVGVDGEVLPLAAAGRLVGGPYAGLRVVTKGGMIGGPDAIAACLGYLQRATTE